MSGEEEGEEQVGEWAPHVMEHGYYCPLMSGSIDGTDKLPHDHAIVRALNANCKKSQRKIDIKLNNSRSTS